MIRRWLLLLCVELSSGDAMIIIVVATRMHVPRDYPVCLQWLSRERIAKMPTALVRCCPTQRMDVAESRATQRASR